MTLRWFCDTGAMTLSITISLGGRLDCCQITELPMSTGLSQWTSLVLVMRVRDCSLPSSHGTLLEAQFLYLGLADGTGA